MNTNKKISFFPVDKNIVMSSNSKSRNLKEVHKVILNSRLQHGETPPNCLRFGFISSSDMRKSDWDKHISSYKERWTKEWAM